MGTDSAFFILGVLGALVGYIVGDAQREYRLRRWKRDVAANLALAVDRTPGGPLPDSDTNGHDDGRSVSDSDGDGDSDRGASRALGSVGNGQARRRAISRPDFRDRPDSVVIGGSPRLTNAATVGRRRVVDYDCA